MNHKYLIYDHYHWLDETEEQAQFEFSNGWVISSIKCSENGLVSVAEIVNDYVDADHDENLSNEFIDNLMAEMAARPRVMQ